MTECKHEFTHVTVQTWFAAAGLVYCKKCGRDADDINNTHKEFRLFPRRA